METEPLSNNPDPDFSFKRHERLSGVDFKRAQRSGRRYAGRVLVVWTFRRPGDAHRPTRFGIVVARRHGPAVRRNLFKRRMRESFRTLKPWPTGWDVVATPKTPGPFPAPYSALREDLAALTRRAGVGTQG